MSKPPPFIFYQNRHRIPIVRCRKPLEASWALHVALRGGIVRALDSASTSPRRGGALLFIANSFASAGHRPAL